MLISSQVWKNGVLIDTNYKFDNRNSYGYNLIIEGTFLITERFLLGVKLFTQPYHNGDINSGALVKVGVLL